MCWDKRFVPIWLVDWLAHAAFLLVGLDVCCEMVVLKNFDPDLYLWSQNCDTYHLQTALSVWPWLRAAVMEPRQKNRPWTRHRVHGSALVSLVTRSDFSRGHLVWGETTVSWTWLPLIKDPCCYKSSPVSVFMPSVGTTILNNTHYICSHHDPN